VREPRAFVRQRGVPGFGEIPVQGLGWNRSGNIKELVTTVNRIRRAHPALALARNIRFLESSNPSIIAYAKITPDLADVLVMVVNLEPHSVQDGTIRLVPELFYRAERGKPVTGGVRPAMS